MKRLLYSVFIPALPRRGVRLRAAYGLAVCLSASIAHAVDKSVHETCFPGILFAQGASVLVGLDNPGPDTREVTIQRYAADGQLMEAVMRKIAGMNSTELRLSAASETPEFGWVRVLDEGKGTSAVVTLKHEMLVGNDLSSVSNTPVFRLPPPTGAPRGAMRYPTSNRPFRHKLDIADTKSKAFFFVNLSDHAVQVGVCEADYACTNPTLPYKVLPLAQVGFPVDRRRRLLVLDSSAGYSVASGWGAESVESSIRFLPTGTVAPVGTMPETAPTVPATAGSPQVPEVARPVAFPRPLSTAAGVYFAFNTDVIIANTEAAAASPAATAARRSVDTLSPEERAALIRSRCSVVTVPAGAEIQVDGSKIGVSPMVFDLLKHGETPRKVTIALPGYETVVRSLVPDGKPIAIGLALIKP